MQAAKAKAAAAAAKKAAAQKKAEAAALEAAAARAQQQQQQKAPAASSSASRPRPSVTQYWADSASSTHAPGGSIIRIGFDQAKFEQAVNECLIEPKEMPSDWLPASQEDATTHTTNGTTTTASELNKQDIALLSRELDLTEGEARGALKRAGGDVSKAFVALTAPAVAMA